MQSFKGLLITTLLFASRSVSAASHKSPEEGTIHIFPLSDGKCAATLYTQDTLMPIVHNCNTGLVKHADTLHTSCHNKRAYNKEIAVAHYHLTGDPQAILCAVREFEQLGYDVPRKTMDNITTQCGRKSKRKIRH